MGANLQFGQAARFGIGLPLPADKQSSEIAGYHCWSDLYVGRKGWIPVGYLRGVEAPGETRLLLRLARRESRSVQHRRDLRLNPPQDGKPLNYFVYPYVEVDGQEYPNVSLAFSFADAVMAVAAKKIGGH